MGKNFMPKGKIFIKKSSLLINAELQFLPKFWV
ncbi:MAG: hypothetical protein RLZZ350_1054 [Verrucomicrobiota bacterium]